MPAGEKSQVLGQDLRDASDEDAQRLGWPNGAQVELDLTPVEPAVGGSAGRTLLDEVLIALARQLEIARADVDGQAGEQDRRAREHDELRAPHLREELAMDEAEKRHKLGAGLRYAGESLTGPLREIPVVGGRPT